MNKPTIISIVVTKDLKQELRVLAAQNSKPLATYLRELLVEHLKNI